MVIHDVEIVSFYGPPHLLKGIRSNLFLNNACFKRRSSEVQVAKWKHIENLFDMESSDENLKLGKKIAGQTLSCNVCTVIKKIASIDWALLPREAVDIAEFILFMDKVFDNVNGLFIKPLNGKKLERTEYLEFWLHSIEVYSKLYIFIMIKNQYSSSYC